MKTFRQLCPSCNRTLELPDTSIGKLAQCPACEATFTAGQNPAATTSGTAAGHDPENQTATPNPNRRVPKPKTSLSQADPSKSVEPTTSSSASESIDKTTTKNQIVSGETPEATPTTTPSDAADPKEAKTSLETEETSDAPVELHTDELHTDELHTDELHTVEPHTVADPDAASLAATESLSPNHFYPEGTNPFSQPLLQNSIAPVTSSPYINANEIQNANVAVRAPVIIVPCSTSDLFKTAWAIMLDRGIRLIASLLFMTFIIASIFVLGTIGGWILSQFVNDASMNIIYYIALILISTSTVIALCRNAIGVARNSPHLLSESSITSRALINTLIPVGLAIAVATYFKWILLDAFAVDRTVATVIGLCTIGTIGWLWISIFLCCDLQCSGFKSLLTATRIFYHNKLTTLALISSSTILILMGIVSYGILLIFTLPFVQLLLATAYLKMTNQPLADPKQ